MATADELFALLPRHVLARDLPANGGTGLLRALLEAIAAEATVLEEDVRGLYDDWFVETARDWALPYLADLLGIEDLPPGRGRRAVVANTVDYRRGKGTVAVAEAVARDVVGAPARAVEHHRLLAVTAHVNHVRTDRPAVAPIRGTTELAGPAVSQGALDPLMHTAEVRRAPSGRGRYGIGNLWVYSFGTTVQALRSAEATPGPGYPDGAGGTLGPGLWWVHPLAVPTPLFAAPAAEDRIDQLAGEAELPVPLRPRRLLTLLVAARRDPAAAGQLPVSVELVLPLPGAPPEPPPADPSADPPAPRVTLGPERILVCSLEDLPADPAGWYAFVDTVSGHVGLFLDGTAVAPVDPGAPEHVLVGHALGGRPGVGAGGHDRTELHEHLVLDTTLYPRATEPPIAQYPVLSGAGGTGAGDGGDGGATGPADFLADFLADSLADALADAEGDWAGQPGTVVVSLGDSGTWSGPGAGSGAGAATAAQVEIPDASRLVLVAAHYGPRRLPDGSMLPPAPGLYAPDGLRPVVRGDLEVTGGAGAAVLLDGITLVGDLVVRAEGMAEVTLSQCTVTGAVRVLGAGAVGATALTLRLARSMVGSVDAAGTVPSVVVRDSILSPEVGAVPLDPAAAETLAAPGAHLDVIGSTVRGDVTVRTLAGTDLLVDGTVHVLHRQVHCLRHSRVGPASRTPRRYRPVEADPAFASVRIGEPDFLVVDAPALATGSETGSEVGVDAHLRRPELLAAARRIVTTYLPAGVDLYLRPSRRSR